MPPLSEYVRSVGWLGLLWLAGVAVVGVMTRRVLRGMSRTRLRALLAEEEDGAAYSLAYVLTLPFYVMFVCLVVEGTLILVAKMGTVYAAYAAARCDIVYHSLDASPARTDERTRRAAVRAMVPFASLSDRHLGGAADLPPGGDLAEYLQAVKHYAGGDPSAAAVRAKYLYAHRATHVSVGRLATADEPRAPVTVTLRYEAPLFVPGVTRFLGRRAPGRPYFVYDITTVVSLPDERPGTPDGRLGITYEAPD